MAQLRRKALVIGISGASSSGKTALTRLLRDIFPNTFILHEDDFFKGDNDLPFKDGLRDGDCAEAILLPSLVAALDYIKTRGTLPPEFESVEDHSSVSKPLVSDSTTAELKARVKKFSDDIPSLAQASLNLCLFEGFLLYGNSVSAIHDYMDIKLFMQVSYKSSKARREARPPYVTRDGIWQDPPGYFDKIVWSNYVAEHQWMFEAGDVDGKLEKDILSKARIEAQIDKDADMDMETTLRWAVETLTREIAKLVME